MVGLANAAVLLDGSDGTTSADEFRSQVVEFAQQHRVTVTIELQDPGLDTHTRHLFIAPGGNGSAPDSWLERGRSSFDRASHAEFAHLDALDNHDARGIYLLQGPAGANTEFLKFAQDRGFEGSVMTSFWLQSWIANASMPPTIALSLLLVFSLTLAYVITQSRKAAIFRLWGKGPGALLGADVREHGVAAGIAGAVTVVLTAGALAAYNGFSQVWLFALCCLLIVSAGVGAIIAGYLAGVAIMHLSPLIKALKGHLPHAVVAGAVIAVRLSAVLAGLALLLASVSLLAESHRLEAEKAIWSKHSEQVAVGISVGSGADYTRISPSLRQLDQQGKLLLADASWHLPEHTPKTPRLLVNTTFARQEAGISPPQLPTAPGEVAVFAPEQASDAELSSTLESINSEAQLADAPGGNPRVTVTRYRGPKEVFTYASSFGIYPPPAIVENPILVVLGPGMTTLSDRNLAAKLTNSSLLFTNEQALDPIMSNPTSRQWLAATYPVIDNWSKARATTHRLAATQVLNLAIALAIICAAAIGTGLTYRARHAQRLHVGYLMGLHPWAMRPGLFLAEAACALVAGLWLIKTHASILQLSQLPGPNLYHLERNLEVLGPVVGVVIVCSALWAALSIAASFPRRRHAADRVSTQRKDRA